jgi:phosphoribosylamine--glycine ligase
VICLVKVLLIGNGAREHAIAEALVKGGAELYAYMGKRNPGIARLCNERVRVGSLEDFTSIAEFGKGCTFAICGPEAPLTAGIADSLGAQGIPVAGPSIEAAQLEGSKIFTRTLLQKYNIAANIQFKIFTSMDGVFDFITQIGRENVVVKPDGLTGGKGVKVWGDHLNSVQEIEDYCKEILQGGGRIIIEEKLDGQEFTYMVFVDGEHVIGTPLVQDNKRAYNDDKGPNTGGMGSYSMPDHLMPFISREDVDFAHKQIELTVQALFKETGVKYKGVLYGQFMKCRQGIRLIEYNARFGDPENINILPIMKTNFVDICQQMIDGTLKGPVEFENKATVVKYLVPEGYPVSPKVKCEIKVDEDGMRKVGGRYYYASVSEENGKILTSSSRTVAVLGVADTIEDAEKIAENATKMVHGPLFHRTDIGTKKIIDRRTKHMHSILNPE